MKWNTLKVNHFLESGLQGTLTLTEEQLKTAIDESLAFGNDDDMLGEVLTVPCYAVNGGCNESAADMLTAYRKLSESTSDSKRESARPSAWKKIGDMGQGFLSGLNEAKLTRRLDTSNISVPCQKRISIDAAVAELANNSKDVDRTFRVCEMLNKKEMKDYCGNPLNPDFQKAALQALSCPAVSIEGEAAVIFTPPFNVSFRCTAEEAGSLENKT